MAHGGQRLHIAGEGSAAHTHKTGFPDLMEDGIVVHLGHGVIATGDRNGGILKIVFNDHRHDLPSTGVGPGLHGNDRAGNGGMDGDTQALTVTDRLATQHLITHLYQGCTGCADMLLHGDHHLFGGDSLEEGDACGHFLVVFGVNTAKKQLVHFFTSCS